VWEFGRPGRPGAYREMIVTTPCLGESLSGPILSGGQSVELASARLNAMNVMAWSPTSRLPWPLVFSFARAIQQPAVEIWQGKETRVAAA
jgi:fructose-bisphosphate aldolase class 1